MTQARLAYTTPTPHNLLMTVTAITLADWARSAFKRYNTSAPNIPHLAWPPQAIPHPLEWHLAEDDVNHNRQHRWPEQKWPRHQYASLTRGEHHIRIDYFRTDSYGPYSRVEEYIVQIDGALHTRYGIFLCAFGRWGQITDGQNMQLKETS